MLVAICLSCGGDTLAQNMGGMGQNIGGGLERGFDGGVGAPPGGGKPGAAPVNCGVGALDLSTGCAQLVAFGVLY